MRREAVKNAPVTTLLCIHQRSGKNASTLRCIAHSAGQRAQCQGREWNAWQRQRLGMSSSDTELWAEVQDWRAHNRPQKNKRLWYHVKHTWTTNNVKDKSFSTFFITMRYTFIVQHMTLGFQIPRSLGLLSLFDFHTNPLGLGVQHSPP